MMRLGIAIAAALLTFCLSANAQTVVKSEDGNMQLTLPNGWKEAKLVGPNSKIRANDGHGGMVVVTAFPKEDFKDFKAFANFSDEKLKKTLPDAEPKAENVQVDGKPALRTTVSGTEESGRNVTFIATHIDAGSLYVTVLVRASASDYGRQQQALMGLADQLKITAAAPPPPPPPPAQAPAAKPPGKR